MNRNVYDTKNSELQLKLKLGVGLRVCAIRPPVYVSIPPLCLWDLPFPLSLFPKPYPLNPSFTHSLRFRRSELVQLSLFASIFALHRISVLTVKIAEFRSKFVDFRHIFQVFDPISYQICCFRFIRIRFLLFD